MSEIILNLSENSDNECLSGEGQMVRGVGRVCTDTQTRVCWDTPVLGRASVSQGQVPVVQLHFSRQQCLTTHFTHTGTLDRSLKVHLPNKRLLFYLSVLLMVTSFATLQFICNFYRKSRCNYLQFTAGETEAQGDELI